MADEFFAGKGRLIRPGGSFLRRLHGLVRERILRREAGQALLEFAIVVPLILLLVLGIADFGLAYNYKNDQTSLANQALRYAEVNACPACGGMSIQDYVKSTADSGELMNGNPPGSFGIQQPGVTITFCLPPGSNGSQGDPLEAKATSSYNWLPFLNLGNVTIESKAIGRLEKAYDSSNPSNNAYSITGPC